MVCTMVLSGPAGCPPQGFPVSAAATNMWAAGVMLVLIATHQPPFFTDGTPNAITKLHKSWVRILKGC